LTFGTLQRAHFKKCLDAGLNVKEFDFIFKVISTHVKKLLLKVGLHRTSRIPNSIPIDLWFV